MQHTNSSSATTIHTPHSKSNSGQQVSLFVAGTGAVGGTLMQQLRQLQPPAIELIGHCNSREVHWPSRNEEAAHTEATEWPAIIKKLKTHSHHPTILVDATGSEVVARLYDTFFKAGIHVVTPSKLANTFQQSYYDELRTIIAQQQLHFRYETTVGAGLPVLSSIRTLLDTGDRIDAISGVVSGTMTYVFTQLEQGVPFSQAIVDAREQGYAEPDPREDLSGEDVARKFLTLAREIGLKMERGEMQVQSLIPEALASVDRQTFLDELSSVDDQWANKMEQARQKGYTLRYTGSLRDGRVHIGVEEVPVQSALGNLSGTDNIIQVQSGLYPNSPLTIQGPGAGKAVTAAGVLADVLHVARAVRAHSRAGQ